MIEVSYGLYCFFCWWAIIGGLWSVGEAVEDVSRSMRIA